MVGLQKFNVRLSSALNECTKNFVLQINIGLLFKCNENRSYRNISICWYFLYILTCANWIIYIPLLLRTWVVSLSNYYGYAIRFKSTVFSVQQGENSELQPDWLPEYKVLDSVQFIFDQFIPAKHQQKTKGQ